MYLVLIAWLYVTLMMAVAEATSATGSVLGAVVTFVFYGLLPMGIVAYILGTPARKRALRAQEQAQAQTAPQDARASSGEASSPVAPDADGYAASAASAGSVPAVRKEP